MFDKSLLALSIKAWSIKAWSNFDETPAGGLSKTYRYFVFQIEYLDYYANVYFTQIISMKSRIFYEDRLGGITD